uniref:Bm8558 n=1 Tax=Brugia malayi TaxID=6279 RepID=A0A1I9G008_BRUMA|nr:Bm8558 [Brugia malayi]
MCWYTCVLCEQVANVHAFASMPDCGHVAQSLHAPFCCPSSAGVAAAVMSACSRGSSSLATCFGHRFALDGIEKCSAMGRMGTACRNTTTE